MNIAIIGSGFAGTILARVLNRQGHEVTVIERGHHPRFALGESSTPLAALSLERLAARWGLDDLHDLATHGRWRRRFPELRRGKKRGFTFYAHRRGQPLTATDRWLVAASPNDHIADVHWLRADVDAFLVDRARAEGVRIEEGAEIDDATPADGGWSLRGNRDGRAYRCDVDWVVDASGGGACLPRALGLTQVPFRFVPPTLLVAAHLTGEGPDATAQNEASWSPGPYDDEWAAVHHLIDGGWIYALRFDHGVTSLGLVLRHDGLGSDDDDIDRVVATPRESLFAWLGRYPTLARQWCDAEVVEVAAQRQVQRRWSTAVGDGWLLMPHTYGFASPLFSTGMAWSLRAVERIATMFATPRLDPDRLEAYGTQLASELDFMDEVIGGAYDLLDRPRHLLAYTFLYFAAASFSESRERLLEPPDRGWAERGFLASDETLVRRAQELERLARDRDEDSYWNQIEAAIRPINVAGLADRTRDGLYPVDLDALVASASRLGLSTAHVRAALPRLRGFQESMGL
ncbi:MAG: FAD-dependent oxidoreductase [Acidobacteriota bacterium]